MSKRKAPAKTKLGTRGAVNPSHLASIARTTRAERDDWKDQAAKLGRVLLTCRRDLERVTGELATCREELGAAKWCGKHSVMQPCQFCPDERIVARLGDETTLRSNMQLERNAARRELAQAKEEIEALKAKLNGALDAGADEHCARMELVTQYKNAEAQGADLTRKLEAANAGGAAMREMLQEAVESIDLVPTHPKLFAPKAALTLVMLRGGCVMALASDAGTKLLAELSELRAANAIKLRSLLAARAELHACAEIFSVQQQRADMIRAGNAARAITEALSRNDIAQADELSELRARDGARPRSHVIAFAAAMEAKLKANDHKGGWHGDAPLSLLRRVQQEMEEFQTAFFDWKFRHESIDQPAGVKAAASLRQKLLDEAADVANMLMMVVDRCDALPRPSANPSSAPGDDSTWRCTCNPPYKGRSTLDSEFDQRWNPDCRVHGDKAPGDDGEQKCAGCGHAKNWHWQHEERCDASGGIVAPHCPCPGFVATKTGDGVERKFIRCENFYVQPAQAGDMPRTLCGREKGHEGVCGPCVPTKPSRTTEGG